MGKHPCHSYQPPDRTRNAQSRGSYPSRVGSRPLAGIPAGVATAVVVLVVAGLEVAVDHVVP